MMITMMTMVMVNRMLIMIMMTVMVHLWGAVV